MTNTQTTTAGQQRKLDKREEWKVMSEIGNRALVLYSEHGILDNKLTVLMDLENAHKCCPIDLIALRDCDDVTFAHDMGGIRHHINRQTGKLENCFVPRTSLRELTLNP